MIYDEHRLDPPHQECKLENFFLKIYMGNNDIFPSNRVTGVLVEYESFLECEFCKNL